MTVLEATVFLLVLLMALPEACRRLHRPGLLYPLYIVAGVAAGVFMEEPVRLVWREIGQFGFILLLFSVGLEIELPEKRESLVALRRALAWMAWQVPLLAGLAWWVGVPWAEGAVAAVALASTSVGMAFHLWEKYPFLDGASRKQFLEWIVAAEVIAILLLAMAGPVLEGAVWWRATGKFLGLVAAAVVAALIAVRLAPRFAKALGRGLDLQVHFLVLLLFGIAAVGERLGLSAPKTAFVLGLFISRSTDREASLSHRLEPLRDRMFVPVFFFGLGTLVEPRHVLTVAFPVAVAAGLGLFFARRLCYRWFFSKAFRSGDGAHVIAAPMLTIAAVAVEVLARAGASHDALAWTIAAGLSQTLVAAFFKVGDAPTLSEIEPAMAAPEAWDEVDTGAIAPAEDAAPPR